MRPLSRLRAFVFPVWLSYGLMMLGAFYLVLLPVGLVWGGVGWTEYVFGLIGATGFAIAVAGRVRYTVLERSSGWLITWWRFGKNAQEEQGVTPRVVWSRPADDA